MQVSDPRLPTTSSTSKFASMKSPAGAIDLVGSFQEVICQGFDLTTAIVDTEDLIGTCRIAYLVKSR